MHPNATFQFTVASSAFAAIAGLLLAGCGGPPPAAPSKSATGDSPAKPAVNQAAPDSTPPSNRSEPPADEPKKPSTLTKTNLDRIQIGMTEKEVYDVLGKPESRQKPEDDPTKFYDYWNVDEQYVNVHFVNGKVVTKVGSGLSPSVTPKLTKANFDKITVGMAEKDLYALLTGPTSAYHTDEALQLTWDDNTNVDKKIIVEVVDGKVSNMTSTGLE